MSPDTAISGALRAALAYLRAGFSVIPVMQASKQPLLAWKEFQARQPTEAEGGNWYRRWPDAGVAIVCGTISNLAVVDCDPKNGDGLGALAPRLPQTPTAETGGGGRHYYFRLLPGERLQKIPALLPGVDLQAEASYVVAPPSVHQSGRSYRWLPGLALGETPLAPLPSLIRQLLALRQAPGAEPTPRRRLNGEGLTLDAVLPALQGVKQCGGGWVALCPAHHDREQSLSVGEGASGKVLLFCHAGCSFYDILAALRGEVA